MNQDGEGVFFRNRYGEGTVFLCAHNVEKTFYEGAGHYEGDAWKIWATVRPVDRLLSTGDRNILVCGPEFTDKFKMWRLSGGGAVPLDGAKAVVVVTGGEGRLNGLAATRGGGVTGR